MVATQASLITGIWDLKKADARIGSFLIFQEELALLCKTRAIGSVDIVILTDGKHAPSPSLETLASLNPFLHRVRILESDSPDSTDAFLSKGDVWPGADVLDKCSYCGSTLMVQKFWQEAGTLVDLRSPPEIQNSVLRWFEAGLDGNMPVAIHLKSKAEDEQSYADPDAWLTFFMHCQKEQFPVTFILVGNDPCDTRILDCPNVLATRSEWGCALEIDMAVVQLSAFFMGMSSGPGALAILSTRPYLIWKHPRHHEEIMRSEFQGHQQFEFATEKQRFFLDWDSAENLIREFERLFEHTQRGQRDATIQV